MTAPGRAVPRFQSLMRGAVQSYVRNACVQSRPQTYH